MTAKQRHREAAFRLAADEDPLGMVRCALRDEPGHTCGGRLQAHHSAVAVQTLRRLHAQANYRRGIRAPATEWQRILATVALADVIADGRNSRVVCELGHRQVELGRFALELTDHERAFCADYGLSYLIEPSATEEAA